MRAACGVSGATASAVVGAVLRGQPARQAARQPRTSGVQCLLCKTFGALRREWTQDGQLWVQYVSSTPATRVDVINLQEQLDHQLQQRQARETGICPIREELYAQAFDELIRQVTINCTERGLLLKRVRDEIRDTIAAYQTLYESSIAFGMRKALMAEQRKGELRALIGKLQERRTGLEEQVRSLEERLESIQSEADDQREREQAAHEEEVTRLRENNNALKASLEDLLAPPKK